MLQMTVGEFKSKFSQVINKILQGKEVAVSYGKKKDTIGIFVPVATYKKKKKVQLGIWKDKGAFQVSKDFKMTDEEFLRS